VPGLSWTLEIVLLMQVPYKAQHNNYSLLSMINSTQGAHTLRCSTIQKVCIALQHHEEGVHRRIDCVHAPTCVDQPCVGSHLVRLHRRAINILLSHTTSGLLVPRVWLACDAKPIRWPAIARWLYSKPTCRVWQRGDS